MKNINFENELKYLCIKDKEELIRKYKLLLNEVNELRKFKATNRERYEKMNKALMTYMDMYGSLDNKKGKNNGVRK